MRANGRRPPPGPDFPRSRAGVRRAGVHTGPCGRGRSSLGSGAGSRGPGGPMGLSRVVQGLPPHWASRLRSPRPRCEDCLRKPRARRHPDGAPTCPGPWPAPRGAAMPSCRDAPVFMGCGGVNQMALLSTPNIQTSPGRGAGARRGQSGDHRPRRKQSTQPGTGTLGSSPAGPGGPHGSTGSPVMTA